MDVLLRSRVVITPSFRLRPRAQLSSGRLLRCGPSRTRAGRSLRLGEDGAPADAACQHRRITLCERLCNLMGIEVVRVAAVENDPRTEPRPEPVRFVAQTEPLRESPPDARPPPQHVRAP